MNEEEKALAAEYALGLLDDEEARRMTRLREDDPALGAEIAFWQEQMASLLASVEPIAPPPRILDGIEGRIFDDAHHQDWLGTLLLPENRPMLVAIVAAKAVLIAGILIFLL
ncbi:hypothetical protein [Palleronia sp. LCG004]|uniref:hypothetical protein n=1 Tax=Palleronia sp. LCG004 TaxID=3079304 RepID=UPI002943D9F2|nr:hypothetical protein [Palleronia sp. LCG004]WOI55228.1 hypothetical protein RVY76_09185 [Palleronia sp. LCG004]